MANRVRRSLIRDSKRKKNAQKHQRWLCNWTSLSSLELFVPHSFVRQERIFSRSFLDCQDTFIPDTFIPGTGSELWFCRIRLCPPELPTSPLTQNRPLFALTCLSAFSL